MTVNTLRRWEVHLDAEFDPLVVEAERIGWDKDTGYVGFYTGRVPVAVFAPGKWTGFVEVFK